LSTTSSVPQASSQRFNVSPMMSAYLILGVALITLSFAAVTMRLAQLNGIPSNLIAAIRLTLAGLILTPIVLTRYREDLKKLTRRDVFWSVFSGVWIGIHFLFMTLALEHSTILIVQVIVNTGPLWVAFLETIFLKTKLTQAHYIAIVVTIIGGMVIAVSSATTPITTTESDAIQQGQETTLIEEAPQKDPVYGAVLALLGAISGSIYLTIGRKARATVATFPYVWMVFSVGGIVTFSAVFLTQTPVFGHPTMGYFWVVVLAIVPHLIGHSTFNHVLGYFSATLASIYGQSITISAALIAFFLFQEVPTLLEIIGSTIIMVGVFLAILTPTKTKQDSSTVITE
jgi:drug/metabolite transporter (DMT)-like permease